MGHYCPSLQILNAPLWKTRTATITKSAHSWLFWEPEHRLCLAQVKQDSFNTLEPWKACNNKNKIKRNMTRIEVPHRTSKTRQKIRAKNCAHFTSFDTIYMPKKLITGKRSHLVQPIPLWTMKLCIWTDWQSPRAVGWIRPCMVDTTTSQVFSPHRLSCHTL